MAHNIVNIPVSNNFIITTFIGYTNEKYGISIGGTVITQGRFVEPDFSNSNYRFNSHEMFGKHSELTEKKASKIFDRAGILPPFLDYTDRSKTVETALESLMTMLKAYNCLPEENQKRFSTYLIVPKQSIKISGKKFEIDQMILIGYDGRQRFYETIKQEIYMKPITLKSQDSNFKAYIPEYIYELSMTHPEESKRPLKNYVESNSISGVLSEINHIESLCVEIIETEYESLHAKKYLCINHSFSDAQNIDSFNHAYCGQNLKISFNWFTAFDLSNSSARNMFTNLKYYSGVGSTDKGRKGVVFDPAQKCWVSQSPNVKILHTEEREQKLQAVEQGFRNMVTQLQDLFSQLNEENIDKMLDGINLKALGNTFNSEDNDK
jgi:hypothetical protein